MPQNALSRLFALLLAFSLAAVACSSSESDDTSATDTDATTESDAGDGGDDDSDGDAADASLDGPVDPESVRELASRLTGLTVEGEQLTCLVSNADDDSALSAVFNGWQQETFQFSPEAFTALTVNVHECVDPVSLSGSLVTLAGGGSDPGAFTGCITNELSAEQTGDLAYAGLAALQVGFAVPEGAQDATVAATSKCIGKDVLANQLASAREQQSGFEVEVDRDCVTEGLDDSFSKSFWEGIIRGDGNTEADIEPLLEDCTSSFDSGLPKEIPADFTEFAGDGVLAGIDPATRNGVYSEAPPTVIEDGVDYQAIFTTTDGEILVDLYEDTAPITVNSFVALARDGYYDKTRFHRVLEGFMAQAGDPTGTGSGGPGFQFDDEESGLTAVDRRGLLAMANSGPNTNGSQFFITLDAASWLDGLHTVFGEVVEGDDVLSQVDLRDPSAPTNRGEELISVVIVEA